MSSWRYSREPNWDKYLVKPADIPTKPHFALLIFEKKGYRQAGYDQGDPETTEYYTEAAYYAFFDKALWEKLISDIYAERHSPTSYGPPKEELVFFQSSGRGSVDVKINVKVGL